MDWLRAAQQLRHDGQPGVLVTVVEVRGHAPREAGAKMVVSRDRSWGSIGGGNLEATAVARAREMMSSRAGCAVAPAFFCTLAGFFDGAGTGGFLRSSSSGVKMALYL